MPDAPPPRRHAAWARRGGVAALLISVALVVRLGTWDVVFQPGGVMLLVDSDPHYHVLRAERMLRAAPGAPWRDPSMNWPHGADLLWPPLFDAGIALAAWAVNGAEATRQEIAEVAVFLPVPLGLATVLLTALLAARLLGGRRGWIAALLVAILPPTVGFTVLGRPDQHAAELALFAASLLAHAVATREDGARWVGRLWLAAILATAFWTWQGSALLLAVPVAFAALAHSLGPALGTDPRRGAWALAAGGLGGALLLALTIAAVGAPGALSRPATAGVNALHVAITGGAGAVGLLLAAFGRAAPARPAWRRVAESLAAILLPAGALLAVWPALRAGAAGGLDALFRGNAWYGAINEYVPMFLGGEYTLGHDAARMLAFLGLLLPACALAVPSAVRSWRRGSDRSRLLLIWVTFSLFAAAALSRRRFEGYLVVAAAPAAEAGIRALVAAAARRWRPLRRASRLGVAATALLVVLPTFDPDPSGVAPLGVEVARAIETFSLMRDATPARGREAVLAPWELGHLVQYYWERPVVVTPFGVDGGAGAFEAWGALFFADTPAAAERAAAARRVAWLVLDNPASDADHLHAYAPPGTPPSFEIRSGPLGGRHGMATASFWQLIPSRLYFQDGRGDGPGHTEPVSGFRLLLESPPTSPDDPYAEEQLKVFGAVPGAEVVVSGAVPGEVVQATATIRANTGRRFAFTVTGAVSDRGRALLRLPYATGANGLTSADPWRISSGAAQAWLSLDEVAVTEGRTVAFSLPPQARRPR